MGLTYVVVPSQYASSVHTVGSREIQITWNWWCWWELKWGTGTESCHCQGQLVLDGHIYKPSGMNRLKGAVCKVCFWSWVAWIQHMAMGFAMPGCFRGLKAGKYLQRAAAFKHCLRCLSQHGGVQHFPHKESASNLRPEQWGWLSRAATKPSSSFS